MADEITFREACCEALAIPPDRYVEAVFWRCLPPRRSLLARLYWHFNRDFFINDLLLIQEVADCTTLSDLRTELANYRFEIRESGFLRVNLHLRMSGQCLVDFAATLLPPG